MIEFNFEYLGSFSESETRMIVKKAISEVLKEMDFKKKYYLSVLLTDNNGIKKINKQYRKINKSTNVLSFPQNENRRTGKSSSIVLGDIVVSLEKVYEESLKEEKHFYNHLSHMIIHSLLHLLGFDHDTKKNFEVMKKKEIFILSKLSISSPYK